MLLVIIVNASATASPPKPKKLKANICDNSNPPSDPGKGKILEIAIKEKIPKSVYLRKLIQQKMKELR